MQPKNNTWIEYQLYMNRLMILFFSISGVFAIILFSALKYTRPYSHLTWNNLLNFSFFTLLDIGIPALVLLILEKYRPNEFMRINFKYLLFAFGFINYWAINTFIPAREMWMSVFYFILLSTFYLDAWLVTYAVILSAGVNVILAVTNRYYLPLLDMERELIMRVVVASLICLAIFATTYFAKRLLSRAARQEEKALDLNRELAAIIDSSKEVAQQLAAASQQMTALTEEQEKAFNYIASTTTDLAVSSKASFTNVNDTFANIKELADHSQAVAERIDSSHQVSNELKELASDGASWIQKALEKISGLKMSIGVSTEKAQFLNENMKQIDAILTIINNIAQQTQLLSLNAAIEAARAGEYGVGFSVVATEIRKLAEETKESLSQVQEIIASVKNEAIVVRNLMENSQKEVDESVEVMAQTGQVFTSIDDSVRKTFEMNEQIRLLARSQLAKVQQVLAYTQEMKNIIRATSEGVENIASASQQNAAPSAEISTAAQQVARLGEQLVALIQ